MSLIHQALKKAQREQLLHESSPGLYAAQGSLRRSSRRWLMFAGSLVVALGVGAALHAWLPRVTRRQVAPEQHQVVVAPATSVPERRMPATPEGSAPAAPERQTAAVVKPVPSVVTPAALPTTVPPPGPPPAPPATQEYPDVASASVPQPARPEPEQSFVISQPPLTTPPSPPATARPAAQPAQGGAASASLPALVETVSPVLPAVSPQARQQALALHNQALALQGEDQGERAMDILRQALALDPTSKVAYNSLGTLYYRRQQYQEALATYQQALHIDPHYAKARNNLGSTYLRLSMDERAREEFQKALQADNAYGLAYYNLACVYARAGDSASAARYLQRAMRLEPASQDWARTDEDFARVRTTPALQRLLGPS